MLSELQSCITLRKTAQLNMEAFRMNYLRSIHAKIFKFDLYALFLLYAYTLWYSVHLTDVITLLDYYWIVIAKCESVFMFRRSNIRKRKFVIHLKDKLSILTRNFSHSMLYTGWLLSLYKCVKVYHIEFNLNYNICFLPMVVPEIT